MSEWPSATAFVFTQFPQRCGPRAATRTCVFSVRRTAAGQCLWRKLAGENISRLSPITRESRRSACVRSVVWAEAGAAGHNRRLNDGSEAYLHSDKRHEFRTAVRQDYLYSLDVGAAVGNALDPSRSRIRSLHTSQPHRRDVAIRQCNSNGGGENSGEGGSVP